MKLMNKWGKSFKDFFKSKEKTKDIEIGDTVMVTSFVGNPIGKVYKITGDKSSKSGCSYWVDLEKFGKMEFSDFELKVLV